MFIKKTLRTEVSVPKLVPVNVILVFKTGLAVKGYTAVTVGIPEDR